MAAEIFEDRVLVRGIPAWHRLGQVIPEDERLTVGDALCRARLDYRLETHPIQTIVTTEQGWGQRLPIPNRVALVRMPDAWTEKPVVLGVVNAKYPFFQNSEWAEMLEPLAEEWPVETIGALGQGELLFVTLRVGRRAIAGRDEVDEFFLVSDWRNGSKPLELAYVPLRVLCWNTLNWALEKAQSRVVIEHHGGFKHDATWALKLMARMRGVRDQGWQVFEALAAAPYRKDALKGDLQRIILDPGPTQGQRLARIAEHAGAPVRDYILSQTEKLTTWELARAQAQAVREDILEVYDRTAEEFAQLGLADTRWHAYNAVVEIADLRVGHGLTAGALARSAQSAVFGTRAQWKTRAMQVLAAPLQGRS